MMAKVRIMSLLCLVLVGMQEARGTILFQDDFNDGVADGWTETAGTWVVQNQEYVGTAGDQFGNLRVLTGESSWSDYILEARMKLSLTDPNFNDFGLIFYAQNSNEYIRFTLGSVDGSTARITHDLNSQSVGELAVVVHEPTMVDGRWYKVRVELQGSSVQAYVDDVLTAYADNLPFTQGYVGLTSDDPTVYFDDVVVVAPGPVADHVDEIDIWQGRSYDNPTDMTPSYVFILAVETDDTVDHIEFLTPGGQTYTIPNDPYTVSGDVETYHDDWGSEHDWEYYGEFDTAEALANYGDGTYTVTIHYNDASTHQTDVWYGVPGTSDPLPQPTQKPVLTAPAYGGTVASPVTLTWEACTDANARTIYLAISDRNTDDDVVDVDLAVGTTESDPCSMPEGLYDIELAFENYYSITNADGILFEYGKVTHLESQFEVPYTTVFRFWSPVTGRHFYTASQNEKDKLIDNYSHVWTFEGPVFKACATDYYPNLAEVHRFWSKSSKAHFYTISESERNKLIDNFSHVWTHEGPVLYAYPEGQQPAEAKPVYRFWKGADNTHFFTISESEKDKLIDNFSHVYTFEGIAFYAYE